MMTEKISGILFDIQRFSLHDGPGVRTTVFLKGCNARCAWCHNPESMQIAPQLSVNLSKCVLCGKCAQICPEGVHAITAEGKHLMRLQRCSLCRDCIAVCPQGIISVVGRSCTAGEVMETVLKDRKYYVNSGGGVTFSGGEPAVQYDFLVALLKLSREAGLHTCIETNGLMSREKLHELSGYVDLFLYDFKVWDAKLHKATVGASNSRVLENLGLLNSLEKQIILRCPVIPSINDRPEHFAAIKALRERYPMICQVELMPYHRTGVSKWENIGLEYTLSDVRPASKEEEARWNGLIR